MWLHHMQEYAKCLAGAVTAPRAQRLYLNTLLFATTSAVLLFIASVAYPTFYYNYVPEKVVSIPVHLQYKYVTSRLTPPSLPPF
jgi:seipin